MCDNFATGKRVAGAKAELPRQHEGSLRSGQLPHGGAFWCLVRDMNTEDDQLQLNLQRLLGRCLLRIQRYERLMKAMLADHELAGPVETLSTQRATRVERFSDKSLGTLVKSLFETCVVPEGFERELLPDDKVPTNRISMAFSVRLSLSQENWLQAKAAIEELVAVRNGLVHHLVEQFDLWSEEGCIAASSHLEETYDRVQRRYCELVQWAKGMAEAREAASAFSQTEAFRELLVNGIEPDRSFDWAQTGLVRVLREAAQTLAVDGWTRLEDARSWVAEKHPEQTPLKYGCRTWPQALSESRQFELQYRADEGRRVAWFRCRPE